MRIMALDASLSCTGVAIYDSGINDIIHVCKIETDKDRFPTRAARLAYICDQIARLIWDFDVKIVVCEDVFVNPRNPQSSLSLGWVRGAIELTIFEMGLEGLLTISPSEVKKGMTGSGNAKKQDVYDAVKTAYAGNAVVMDALMDKLYTSGKKKNEDKADACAIAHVYVHNPTLAAMV